MVSVNKIIIIGNLGGEPEMRFAPSGKPVTSFNVATNHRYTTGEGELKEETEWFTVVTWGKLAEQCNQFLNKGRLVYVEGRLHSHSWDGQDGQKHFRNEIIANRVSFLDRQGAAVPAAGEKVSKSSGSGGDDIEPEDLPF
jgi:single-strand DNA-binding protein